MAMNNNSGFMVLRFLHLPYENIDRYVCVLDSWMVMRSTHETMGQRKVFVKFPIESPEVTRRRVENREPCEKNWNSYLAIQHYTTDNYEDADIWIIAYTPLQDDDLDTKYNGNQSKLLKKDKISDTAQSNLSTPSARPLLKVQPMRSLKNISTTPSYKEEHLYCNEKSMIGPCFSCKKRRIDSTSIEEQRKISKTLQLDFQQQFISQNEQQYRNSSVNGKHLSLQIHPEDLRLDLSRGMSFTNKYNTANTDKKMQQTHVGNRTRKSATTCTKSAHPKRLTEKRSSNIGNHSGTANQLQPCELYVPVFVSSKLHQMAEQGMPLNTYIDENGVEYDVRFVRV